MTLNQRKCWTERWHIQRCTTIANAAASSCLMIAFTPEIAWNLNSNLVWLCVWVTFRYPGSYPQKGVSFRHQPNSLCPAERLREKQILLQVQADRTCSTDTGSTLGTTKLQTKTNTYTRNFNTTHFRELPSDYQQVLLSGLSNFVRLHTLTNRNLWPLQSAYRPSPCELAHYVRLDLCGRIACTWDKRKMSN